MILKNGTWIACVLEDGTKAVGIVIEEFDTLYANCITEVGAVTTTKIDRLQSWCEIIVDWE